MFTVSTYGGGDLVHHKSATEPWSGKFRVEESGMCAVGNVIFVGTGVVKNNGKISPMNNVFGLLCSVGKLPGTNYEFISVRASLIDNDEST